MHVNKSDTMYRFKSNVYTGEGSIAFGIYDSLDALAREINSTLLVGKHQTLEPAQNQKGFYALRRTCKCKDKHTTNYSQKILRVFGFESDDARMFGKVETKEKLDNVVLATRPASLARALVDQLYVYTDICTPYTVGDTQASLLRIVSLDNSNYRFGSNVTKNFAPRHYVPLLHHSLQSIVIDIRDSQGKPVPFEYGTLTATLHFKRVR